MRPPATALTLLFLLIPLPSILASDEASDETSPTEENLSLDELKKQRDQTITEAKNKNDTLQSINGKLNDKLAEALEANRTFVETKGKYEGLEKIAVEKENDWKGPLIKAQAEFTVAENFFISAQKNFTAANFTLTEAQSNLGEANTTLIEVKGRPDRLKKANETKIAKTARKTTVTLLKDGIQADFNTKQTKYNEAKEKAEYWQKEYKDANCDDPTKTQTVDCTGKKSKRDHFNGKLTDVTPAFEQVNTTMNGYIAEISKLTGEISAIEKQMNELKMQLKNHKSYLELAEFAVGEYTTAVSDATPIFNKAKGIFDQAQIDYEAKEAAKTTAEQKLNAGEPQDVKDAKAVAGAAEMEYDTARGKLETVNGEVDELKKSAATAQKSYNEAKTEADSAEKRYDAAMRKDAEARKGTSGAQVGLIVGFLFFALAVVVVVLVMSWRKKWGCFKSLCQKKQCETTATPQPSKSSKPSKPTKTSSTLTSTSNHAPPPASNISAQPPGEAAPIPDGSQIPSSDPTPIPANAATLPPVDLYEAQAAPERPGFFRRCVIHVRDFFWRGPLVHYFGHRGAPVVVNDPGTPILSEVTFDRALNQAIHIGPGVEKIVEKKSPKNEDSSSTLSLRRFNEYAAANGAMHAQGNDYGAAIRAGAEFRRNNGEADEPRSNNSSTTQGQQTSRTTTQQNKRGN